MIRELRKGPAAPPLGRSPMFAVLSRHAHPITPIFWITVTQLLVQYSPHTHHPRHYQPSERLHHRLATDVEAKSHPLHLDIACIMLRNVLVLRYRSSLHQTSDWLDSAAREGPERLSFSTRQSRKDELDSQPPFKPLPPRRTLGGIARVRFSMANAPLPWWGNQHSPDVQDTRSHGSIRRPSS